MTKALSIPTPVAPPAIHDQDIIGIPDHHRRELEAIQSRATWEPTERVWMRLHRFLRCIAMELFMGAHPQSVTTSPVAGPLRLDTMRELHRTARDIPTTCLRRARALNRLHQDGCLHPAAQLGAPCCAVVDLLLDRDWEAER